jgi:hypothetical protein
LSCGSPRVVSGVERLPGPPVSDLVGVNAIHGHALGAVEGVGSDVDLAVASLVAADLCRWTEVLVPTVA